MDRVSQWRVVHSTALVLALGVALPGSALAGEAVTAVGDGGAVAAPVGGVPVGSSAGSSISTIGLHQAVPNSTIEQIAVYQSAMRQAMALKDPAQRQAGIDQARAQLMAGSKRPMTPEMAARVDSLLGLDVIAPTAAQIQR